MLNIKHLMEKFNLSVIAVCETWLVPDVPSSFVAIDGFWFVLWGWFRCCSQAWLLFVCFRVLFFVPVKIYVPNIAGVLLVDVDVWVFVVYRPLSYTVDLDDRLIKFLNEFIVGKEVIIVGAFKLPLLDWSSDNVLHGYMPPCEMFFDCFSLLGVEEGAFVDSAIVLDLVLTTEMDRVDVFVLASFPRCHHCPVVFEYVFQFDNNDSINSEWLLWCKGNYGTISADVRSWDCEFDFAGRSIDECFQYFVSVLQGFICWFVSVSCGFCLAWMRGASHWLEKSKTENGKYVRKYGKGMVGITLFLFRH